MEFSKHLVLLDCQSVSAKWHMDDSLLPIQSSVHLLEFLGLYRMKQVGSGLLSEYLAFLWELIAPKFSVQQIVYFYP